jgi:hypothetical protein
MQLILFVLLTVSGILHAHQYFDINSCFLRDPAIGGLVESKDLAPFSLKLSQSTYESSSPEPLIVSIVKNQKFNQDHLKLTVDLDSFIIQAVQSDDEKILGKWVIPEASKSYLNTLDCFGERVKRKKWPNSIESVQEIYSFFLTQHFRIP